MEEGLSVGTEQNVALPEQHVSTAMVAWVEPQPPPTPPPLPPPQYVSPLAIPYPLITIAPPPGHYQLRHPHQIALQVLLLLSIIYCCNITVVN